MSRRASIRRASLIAAALAGVAAIVIAATGGIAVSPLGIRITARDPVRPLYVAAAALLVYFLAGGSIGLAVAGGTRFVRAALGGARRRLRAIRPAAAAAVLAAAVTAVAWIWGTKAVGGADSYGYLSQAELWLHGLPRVEQPFVRDVPWPDALDTFTPLAYRPAPDSPPGDGSWAWTLVPIYSAGLPLILAAAKLMGGTQAMFMVVPVLTGVLVLLTFHLGRAIVSDAAGLIAAWLVATSPAVLFMMMTTMTDVPVAGVWALASWLVVRDTGASAFGAGLASAVAVLIRPNHVVLVPALGMFYALGLADRRTRAASLRRGALFSAGMLPGVVAVAAINTALYGSPGRSGYGNLDGLFSAAFVWPNARNYVGWLVETQTWLPVAGLLALCLPVLRVWPRTSWRAVTTLALFVGALWGHYLLYAVWDAWWYLRFLIASWPMIMVGTGALLVGFMRWRPALTTPLIVAGVFGLGVWQVSVAESRSTFDLWEGERRYVVAAQMVRRLTDRNSVIVSGQHSGPVRFYGSRMSMHFDAFPPDVDGAIDWLLRHGAHPYLLLEPWELDVVQQRFRGHRAEAALRNPLAVYRDPGSLYLFDLDPGASHADTEVITGTYRDLWAVGKAPDPRLVFQP
ncbi:MAG: glycosyltransferase family 39 protein [Acidobacteria bacterium]|nr:glycosyltransferase family 39 protein [Acidobacteriota bacterium]